jgi:uncharacterized protein (TIGR01777 family)
MKVLLSGASGLIGSAVSAALTAAGHQVVPLARQKDKPGAVYWDPVRGDIEQDKLQGFDAVIHLAGENIVGKWTAEKKQRIRDSRVKGTAMLCDVLTRLAQPPGTLLCASAIGYYGNRGDEVLTERSLPGDSFLAKVCDEWEVAAAPAVSKGIRVANMRIGMVLTPRGGALTKLLTPFRLGVGGKVGPGTQYMSWITLDDVVGAFLHALQTEALIGPVNVVSPNPVTNYQFTKTLGRVLFRPTIFPLPSFMARFLFGEMANELLLASTRVLPTRLQETGYQFRHPNLEAALRHLLGKEKTDKAA